MLHFLYAVQYSTVFDEAFLRGGADTQESYKYTPAADTLLRIAEQTEADEAAARDRVERALEVAETLWRHGRPRYDRPFDMSYLGFPH